MGNGTGLNSLPVNTAGWEQRQMGSGTDRRGVKQERREFVYVYYTFSIVLLSLQFCFFEIVQLLISMF